MKKIAIYGAGGFGREVLMLINSLAPAYQPVGFYDDGLKKGTLVNGLPVLGGIRELSATEEALSVCFAIGSPVTKQKIILGLDNPNLDFPTLIHPSAIIGDADYVKIGRGCIICANTILTVNIEVKDFVILNLACTVGHDTIIGEYSSFMPNVNISGEVEIGEKVYVGTGAKIINQVSIGSSTIVGAGAVVTRSLPPSCTAVGMPAKAIKFHNNL